MTTQMLQSGCLPRPEIAKAILARGAAAVSRQKYQSPRIKEWISKGGVKFWRGEWRIEIEGRAKPKHRVQTWPQRLFTKSKAQKELDLIVRKETSGPAQPDGSMIFGDFWTKIYWPVMSRRLASNSKIGYRSAWRLYLEPTLGKMPLQAATKHDIEMILGDIADAGKSNELLKRVLRIAGQIFEEAIENNYITRDPTRRIELPRVALPAETRSMTEDEVRRLFDCTTGKDRLMWRLLVLVGLRIGELLALTQADLIPVGLCIDESALDGHPSTTKNRKIRYAPLPSSLRAELEEHAAGVGNLLFPSITGRMERRSGDHIRAMIKRARVAAGIPDLTPRMCRTTYATLYHGDEADRTKIMGHHSTEFTLLQYRKAITSRQQAAAEEMDMRLSGKVIEMPMKERA